MDARTEYDSALADFSQPGNRWDNIGRLTFWGKAAGLAADDVVNDAHAVGVRDRDADIRRSWATANPQTRMEGCANWRRTARRRSPPAFPSFVRDCIGEGGGEARAADLQDLSPATIPGGGAEQTAAFLRSLFDPSDILFVFRDDAPQPGRLGINLRPCADWLAVVENGGRVPGDLIVPNPMTGERGETAGGKPSLVAQSCIVRFPFMLVEFDDMPLTVQAAFWRGLIRRGGIGAAVAAITYSGGKSLHALLHAGCSTLAQWVKIRDGDADRGAAGIVGFLASDADRRFRVDVQSLRPRQGTRIPGVRRFSSGRIQRLIYFNPDAVRTVAEP